MENQSGPDLLTVAELMQKARVSKSTTVRWRRNGIGPKPIKVGPRAIRYSAREVDAFLGLSKSSTDLESA